MGVSPTHELLNDPYGWRGRRRLLAFDGSGGASCRGSTEMVAAEQNDDLDQELDGVESPRPALDARSDTCGAKLVKETAGRWMDRCEDGQGDGKQRGNAMQRRCYCLCLLGCDPGTRASRRRVSERIQRPSGDLVLSRWAAKLSLRTQRRTHRTAAVLTRQRTRTHADTIKAPPVPNQLAPRCMWREQRANLQCNNCYSAATTVRGRCSAPMEIQPRVSSSPCGAVFRSE